MSDFDDNVDDEQNDDQDQSEDGVRLSLKDLRALRKKARQYDEVSTKMTQLEREMVFAKAKLDLDSDPRLRYFVDGYKGELTVEAIRAQAEKDGFLNVTQPQPTTSDDEIKAHQRLVNASQGGGDVGDFDVGEALRNARSPQEVMDVVIRAGLPTTLDRQ